MDNRVRPSSSTEYRTQYDRLLGPRTDQKACDCAVAFCHQHESFASRNLYNIFEEAKQNKR